MADRSQIRWYSDNSAEGSSSSERFSTSRHQTMKTIHTKSAIMSAHDVGAGNAGHIFQAKMRHTCINSVHSGVIARLLLYLND